MSNQELHLYTSETPLLGPACFGHVFPLILKSVFTVHLRDEHKTEVESTYMEESEVFHSVSVNDSVMPDAETNYLAKTPLHSQKKHSFPEPVQLSQPILLAPLLHYLSIHISVSVMAKVSKFVRTSCFSHTSYIYTHTHTTFQYNHLDYIRQGIKLPYMKPLELELSAQNTLQKTWNLNSRPLLCMLFADESQNYTVHRYSQLLAPNG